MRRPVSAEESLKKMASFFEERARKFVDTMRRASDGVKKGVEGMPAAGEKNQDDVPDSRSPKP